MMNPTFRCACPITSALDLLGDKWMLVLIKQMLFEDKETFKDFMESPESIATNILSSKLKQLESVGIVTKTKRPNNKKTNRYLLSDKGLALAPVLIELTNWSIDHIQELHPTMAISSAVELLKQEKNTLAKSLIDSYKAKISSSEIVE